MKTRVVCFLVLVAVFMMPFMTIAQTNAFEGLRDELKACRTIVMEGVDKKACTEMLAKVKVMNVHIAELFKQAKLDGEGNYVSALQRDVEMFRFQCALFEEGITDVGVISAFGSLLKTFIKYKDFRAANGI